MSGKGNIATHKLLQMASRCPGMRSTPRIYHKDFDHIFRTLTGLDTYARSLTQGLYASIGMSKKLNTSLKSEKHPVVF
jgi:hypothetical protein